MVRKKKGHPRSVAKIVKVRPKHFRLTSMVPTFAVNVRLKHFRLISMVLMVLTVVTLLFCSY